MTTFASLQIARTGAGFAHHWIETIAHNVANVGTRTNPADEPFRQLHLVARPNAGGPFAPTGSGVHLSQQIRSDEQGVLVYDPGNPLADDAGYVQMPIVDLAGQMTDLLIAQRAYQANLRTIEGAREAYQSALRLGGH